MRLIGLWVKLLRVPYRLLFPAIVGFCCVGLYSIANDAAQVMMAALFGIIGYALYKLEFEPAPLALGFVLGRLLEEKLRQSLIISGGSPLTFLQSPLSAILLAIAPMALVIAISPSMRRNRDEVFKEA
ncbi:tripartite tricarboxylate transporter permease [Ensifer adhaerens]|uniref:tripartite tricarboxylate transporter permease n=1 Tax=Ensifer adhaerens TaxID=106592 RepID=UPI003D078132